MNKNINLFRAELRRGMTLLKAYPLDTINNLISFTVVSVLIIIGINKIGEPQQIFSVFLFPIIMTLISGPSSSIRSDIEIGVFEQVYTSKYTILSVGVIRSIINAIFSSANSILIFVIVQLFFHNTKWKIVELLFVLVITVLTSISLGVFLAGLTIKFRKTETLLNLINIMALIELIVPFSAMSSNIIYIVSAILPFSGIIVCIQNIYNKIANLNEIYLFGTTVSNVFIIIVFSKFIFNKCMKWAKIKGDLGNY